MVIQTYLGAGVEHLYLITDKHHFFRSNPEPRPKLATEDINVIAVKCPNLKKLHIRGFAMEPLPALENPWNLEHLILDLLEMVRWDPLNNKEFHASLPNLRKIEMGRCMGPSSLPDMSKCEKLEEVSLYKCGVYPTVFPGAIRAGIIDCSTYKLNGFNETCACGFPRNLKLYVYRCPFLYFERDCYRDRLGREGRRWKIEGDYLFEDDICVHDVHLS